MASKQNTKCAGEERESSQPEGWRFIYATFCIKETKQNKLTSQGTPPKEQGPEKEHWHQNTKIIPNINTTLGTLILTIMSLDRHGWKLQLDWCTEAYNHEAGFLVH